MHRAGVMMLLVGLGGFAQSPDEKEIPQENPYQSQADVARGKQLFLGHCAPCHGPGGEGGKGANLARPSLPRAADDQALFRVVRGGIPGTEMPGAWEMIDHEVWQVAAYVRTLGHTAAEEPLRGDRGRGEQLFRGKGNCLHCHTVGSEGGRVGPVLSEVGRRRSPSFLRQAVLQPQSALPEYYQWIDLVTRDKTRIAGIRLSEDTYSIRVRDLSDGIHSLWKAELLEIHRDPKRTPMPGYRSAFSDGELDDLVAYLANLRGVQ